MKIAAVVVLYYPTNENIDNISKYKSVVDKIYVIDNSDDDIIRLKSTKKIEYIKLSENKGIAYALNMGAKLAIKNKYKWLLTLDQDSKITKKNIEDLVLFADKHKKEKDIGIISPYQDIGKDDVIPEREYEDIIEIMTSGNLINLLAYKKVGGFKDWLFIDCVDTDYCMNLHNHGFRVLRCNKIVMKHSLGNLVIHKFLGKDYDCYNHNAIRRYYIVRNNLYIRDMYGDIYYDYCNHLIRVQKGQLKRVLFFEKNKFQKIKMMFKGYLDHKHGIKGKLR